MWDAIKATTPISLTCPRCKGTLLVRMPLLWPFVICVGLVFLTLGFGAAWELCALRFAACFAWMGTMAVFLVIAEIGTGLLYYNCARLEPSCPGAGR